MILILFVFFSSLFCSAEEGNTFSDLLEQYHNLKGEVISKDERQRKEMSDVYQISKHVKKIARKRASLDSKLKSKINEIQDLKSDIDELNKEKENSKKILSTKLRFFYRLKRQNLSSLFFKAKTATQLDRNLKILSEIAKQDSEQIKKYELIESSLIEKMDSLNKEYKAYQVQKTELTALEADLNKKQIRKTQFIARLRNQKQSMLKKLLDLKKETLSKEEGEVTHLLMLKESFFEKKGKLNSPIAGKLKQPFGLLTDVKYNVNFYNKGISIQPIDEKTVSAIFHGKVLYADYHLGYENIIILDHGDHYFSVYGNLRSLYVVKGDFIKEGVAIGSVGYSMDFGQNLYFEIRHFSEPVDPSAWLRHPLKSKMEYQNWSSL